MVISAIEVEFGPHWGDLAQIVLTVLSIGASVWLGALAYKNGKKASSIAGDSAKIAKESAQRDAEHKEHESRLRAQRQRDEVGLAMMRTLTALNVYVVRSFIDSPGEQLHARRALEELKSEAISLIDLFPSPVGLENELRDWFDNHVNEIVSSTMGLGHSFEEMVRQVDSLKTGVRGWTKERIPVQSLPGFFEGDSL